MKVTYLGPSGATFSAIAYEALASRFEAPSLKDPTTEEVLAGRNEDIVRLILGHGGYGAIAMETKAEGRVDPPINSFIELLGFEDIVPFQVIGALRMKLHFALMARAGLSIDAVRRVVAHPKAIGACKKRVQGLGVEVIDAPSNGIAAQWVAEDQGFSESAALAPALAAEKYGLSVLHDAFEDSEAITTFFLLGPKGCDIATGEMNRGLLVFQAEHMPGALVKILTPFASKGINLFHVHSLYVGDGEYRFAIETECPRVMLSAHEEAVCEAKMSTSCCLEFGPFPVVSN